MDEAEVDDASIIELNAVNALDENGEIKHRYYKTTWRFPNPPYCYCPFYLKGYNPKSKKFTITVLTDKRDLDFIPVGFPCVQISEEEAQQLVDHRLGVGASPAKKKEVIEQVLKDASTSVIIEPKRKRGRAVNENSVRQITLRLHGEGKNREEIITEIKKFHPNKDRQQIISLVNFYIYEAREKVVPSS